MNYAKNQFQQENRTGTNMTSRPTLKRRKQYIAPEKGSYGKDITQGILLEARNSHKKRDPLRARRSRKLEHMIRVPIRQVNRKTKASLCSAVRSYQPCVVRAPELDFLLTDRALLWYSSTCCWMPMLYSLACLTS